MKLVSLVCVLCLIACNVAQAGGGVSAQVSAEGKKMLLTATYEVPVTEAQVLAVLTDFDAMPQYMPGLTESRILSREGNVLQVQQKGRYHWGLISGHYDSIREMTLLAHGLHGHSLDAENGPLDSDTTLSSAGGRTVVSYRAIWWPASGWVRTLGERAVREGLESQMTAQYEEILRRAAAR